MEKNAVKILIVNPQMELRNILRDYLKEEGFTRLSISETGESALKKARLDPPDLILASQDLPGMSGVDLLKEIRLDRELSETAFILLSSETDRQSLARAVEHQVNAYLVVPFSRQILAEKVHWILERSMNPSEVDLEYREATRLLKEGHPEAALEKLMLVLSETQKTQAVLHYKVGRVHEKMNRDQEAEEDFHQALGLSDMYLDAYDALGALNLRNDRPENALEYLNRVTRINPLNAKRQLNLGEALLSTGDFAGAEKAFKTALALDPTQTHVFNRLGIAMRRQGKLTEALHFFLEAVRTTPEDENLHYNLSRVYLDQQNPRNALAHLDKALELKPDFTEAVEFKRKIQETQN